MSQEADMMAATGATGVSITSGRIEILERLDALIAQFGRLIECRSHDALQQPGQDGHWGVVEILCHLRDWEIVVHDRVDRILARDTPHLEDPDTTMWPLEHNYGDQDSHDVFRQLAALRQALVTRLGELDAEAWTRVGVLDGHGELSLGAFLEQVVSHDARHVREARDAVA